MKGILLTSERFLVRNSKLAIFKVILEMGFGPKGAARFQLLKPKNMDRRERQLISEMPINGV